MRQADGLPFLFGEMARVREIMNNHTPPSPPPSQGGKLLLVVARLAGILYNRLSSESLSESIKFFPAREILFAQFYSLFPLARKTMPAHKTERFRKALSRT